MTDKTRIALKPRQPEATNVEPEVVITRGRPKLYATVEEQKEARKLWNKKYYETKGKARLLDSIRRNQLSGASLTADACLTAGACLTASEETVM